MKKIIAISTILCIMCSVTGYASRIPDHRGTDLDLFEIGTKELSARVSKYSELFKQAGDQYGIDPNILAAVCMQESSGINYSIRDDGTEYPAWGIMQIEYTHEKAFAAFGLDRTGVAWTLNDRLDPEKAIPYAAYLLSESLYRYDDDYIKMLQAYNFGDTVLDRIINAVGDKWLDERINAAKYADNWKYEKYGDALYAEHVLAYYHNNIDYIGAKVRKDGELIKFNDQYPIIKDGITLIPVRAVSEKMGAEVEWDGENGVVTIDKDGTVIKLYTGTHDAYVDGEKYTLDHSAEIINNRTLVPLRFVAESLDLTVNWDGETRTVEIS